MQKRHHFHCQIIDPENIGGIIGLNPILSLRILIIHFPRIMHKDINFVDPLQLLNNSIHILFDPHPASNKIHILIM